MNTSTTAATVHHHKCYVEAKNDLRGQVKHLSTIVNWILTYHPYDPQMALFEYYDSFITGQTANMGNKPSATNASASSFDEKICPISVDPIKWIAWTLRPQTFSSQQSQCKISLDQMIIQAYLYPTLSSNPKPYDFRCASKMQIYILGTKLQIQSFPSCIFAYQFSNPTKTSTATAPSIVTPQTSSSLSDNNAGDDPLESMDLLDDSTFWKNEQESFSLETFQNIGWTVNSLKALILIFKNRWEKQKLLKSFDEFSTLLLPLKKYLVATKTNLDTSTCSMANGDGKGGKTSCCKISFMSFSAIIKFLVSVQGYLSESKIIYKELYGNSPYSSDILTPAQSPTPLTTSTSFSLIQEISDQMNYWTVVGKLKPENIIFDRESNEDILQERLSHLISESFRSNCNDGQEEKVSDASTSNIRYSRPSPEEWYTLWLSILNEQNQHL